MCISSRDISFLELSVYLDSRGWKIYQKVERELAGALGGRFRFPFWVSRPASFCAVLVVPPAPPGVLNFNKNGIVVARLRVIKSTEQHCFSGTERNWIFLPWKPRTFWIFVQGKNHYSSAIISICQYWGFVAICYSGIKWIYFIAFQIHFPRMKKNLIIFYPIFIKHLLALSSSKGHVFLLDYFLLKINLF